MRGEKGRRDGWEEKLPARGELMWKVSLIRWNVCPLPQIPSCGAKKKKKKKRPKLMSLGRTICLSGLLLRDKKLLFASVPMQCPWLWRMWRWMKGGAKDFWRAPCMQKWWQAWHLSEETHELPSETSDSYERNKAKGPIHKSWDSVYYSVRNTLV